MVYTLAHITQAESPAGLLLFLAGIAVGALATSAFRRLRAS